MTDMYSRSPRYVRKANVTPYKYCLSKVPEINDDTGESYNDCKMAYWSVKIAVCQYSFEWTLHIGQ